MQMMKSIDELYEEVKDFDLVICNDAPLALALNNRLDVAKLGVFAITPRQIAADMMISFYGKAPISDINLVKRISSDTGYGLRFVHGEIENIKRMLRFVSDPGQYLRKKSFEIYQEYSRYNTLDNLMRNFDNKTSHYYDGKKVVVIGLDLFDNLDKFMLPYSGYEEVSLHVPRKDFSIPEIRMMGNDRQLAQCAVDIVRKTNPTDVAIILDSSSSIADVVRSALYRNRVPFINSLSMKDLNAVRDYLEFISLSLDFETIQVKKVRELISAYKGEIKSKFDEYYLSAFSGTSEPNEKTRDLLDHMKNITHYTFSEICTDCVPGADRGNIRILLKEMESADELVTPELLADMIYAVNNISSMPHNEQIPVEEKEGVLLADCKRSVYVDRPVVIHIGLGTEWNRDLKDHDFLSKGQKMDVDDQNCIKFTALLQQGTVRFYLANATKGGKTAEPCELFDMSEGNNGKITSFEDICDNIISGPWEIQNIERGVRFDTSSMEKLHEKPPIFSASAYNNYAKCPRMYLYGVLSRNPDNSLTYTGNRIHEYAEFRATYPEIAKENGPDFYADMIADECASLYSPSLMEVERSKIRSEVRMIDRFMEEIGVIPEKIYPSSEIKNMFFLHHGLTNKYENTERKMQSLEGKMYGIMDLLWKGIVYDLKTGNFYDAKAIVDKLTASKKEKLDYQAYFYLCMLQDTEMENHGIFRFVYPKKAYEMETFGDTPKVSDCITSIILEDSFKEAFLKYNEDFFTSLVSYKNINLSEALEICLEFDNPVTWHEQEEIIGIVKNRFNISKSTSVAAIKKLGKAYASEYIIFDNQLIIPRSTLDKFREKVLDDYDSLKICYETDFSKSSDMNCSKCHFKDMCTFQSLEGGEEDVFE